MDVQLIQALAEFGIGGLALFLFYKIISNMAERHKEERKEDSELWRAEVKERSERTDEVIKELTTVIRDINRK